MEQIGWLYEIERKAKEQQLNAARIYELHQKESVPILESFGKWMKELYLEALPKSAIGKSLGYSTERWLELMVYEKKLYPEQNKSGNKLL